MMFALSRCTGPECPRCGCAETKEIDRRVRRGWRRERDELIEVEATTIRRRCCHCGTVWTESEAWVAGGGEKEQPPEPTPVPASYRNLAAACDECGSEQIRVTSTRKLWRYYKCAACGYTWKKAR